MREFRVLGPEEEIYWEKISLATKPNLFVRSSLYGKFYEKCGHSYVILGVWEDQVLVGGAMFVRVEAKRGSYLYAPYGPILDWRNKEQVTEFFGYVRKFGKEQKVDFVKLSPFEEDRKELRNLFKEHGFRPSPLHVLAETTWMLSLKPSEADLMSSMRQNTRNLIRRSAKEGVEVTVSQELADVEYFFPLFNETAKRHDFIAYTEDYIRKEFETFAKFDMAFVYNAWFEGEVISSAIVYRYGNTTVYRHGASTHKHAKIPSSYGLQWKAICDARQAGCAWYNFWGIAPDDAPRNHPFYGITRFKKGFGGEVKHIVHCHDLPITWKYWFNWGVESFRKWRRGF